MAGITGVNKNEGVTSTTVSGKEGIDVNVIATTGDGTSMATSITSGTKSVTTAGTAESLAASATTEAVIIQALAANTGSIYVGGTTVASTNGADLTSGESVTINIDDIAKIFIDSSVNGEGVTYQLLA